MGFLGSLGLAAGGSILSGLFGGDGQDDANQANRDRMNQIMQLLRGSSVRNRILYSNAENILRARSRAVMQDVDRAESELRTGTRQAQQDIRDTETRAVGEATQGLVGRGLSSSSVAANFRRGIAADTSRAFGRLHQTQAGQMANLAMQRSQIRTGLQGDLANLQISRAGAERANILDQAGFLERVTDTYDPGRDPRYGGLGEGIGALGGFLNGLGGLFGGG